MSRTYNYIVDLGKPSRPAGYLLIFLPCPCPVWRSCPHRPPVRFFFLPISRGNWATWISGKAPPSPKSYNTKQGRESNKLRLRGRSYVEMYLHLQSPTKQGSQTQTKKKSHITYFFPGQSTNTAPAIANSCRALNVPSTLHGVPSKTTHS